MKEIFKKTFKQKLYKGRGKFEYAYKRAKVDREISTMTRKNVGESICFSKGTIVKLYGNIGVSFFVKGMLYKIYGQSVT